MSGARAARAMLDGAPIAMAVIAPDGRVLYSNAKHEALYGRTFSAEGREVVRDVRDFYVNPEDRARLAEQYRSTGVMRDAEVHLKRPDGTTFWALLTWQETIWEGEPARVSWLYNISGVKAAEAAAEEARRVAEAASRAKSEFLANMSHELRTPLNAIIGYAQILQEDAQDLGQEAMLPDLKRIEAAGKHLLGLINGILDLSKIEAGRAELYLESVDLAALAQEVTDLIRPLAGQRANTLRLELPEAPGRLRTDLVKLKQSLLNLLSNACKFTEGGTVTLRLARAEGELRLSVMDTGIGMTDAQAARLYEPFTQADASTTRQYGGTGLGLAITQRFVTMLGGRITLETAPGKGSTFTLHFPDNADPTPAPRRAQTGAPATGDAPVLLLVDDDPEVHDLLGTMLTREGYRVEHVHRGRDAVARALDIRPAAILLDVMMPQVDGWTVLAALKAEAALREVPVVMVSMLDERPLGLSLGAADYLTKPVDRELLAATLRAKLTEGADALVVEDQPEEREAVLAALREAGLKARGAASAPEALTILTHNAPPALLVLDLMLPGMDGFDLLDLLRRERRLKATRLVVITARELTEAERHFLTGEGGTIIAKGPGFRQALLSALPRRGA